MWRNAIAIIKLTCQMVLVVSLGFAISLGIHISVVESTRLPTGEELKSLNNISSHLTSQEYNTVKTSRNSIVQVLSGYAKEEGFAKMSGTYVTYDEKFYVITAAHGIVGGCSSLYVAVNADIVCDCIQYVIVDKWTDYAIIQVEKVPKRTPISLQHSLPVNNQWKRHLAILNEVFYTGYPNGLGPLTFRGDVVGLSPDNYIYLHSYAWPGSSGAGVFSRDGKLIGIVIALNVGLTSAGYDVLEDLVIVTPLFMVDWDLAYSRMQESPEIDTGDTGE